MTKELFAGRTTNEDRIIKKIHHRFFLKFYDLPRNKIPVGPVNCDRWTVHTIPEIQSQISLFFRVTACKYSLFQNRSAKYYINLLFNNIINRLRKVK